MCWRAGRPCATCPARREGSLASVDPGGGPRPEPALPALVDANPAPRLSHPGQLWRRRRLAKAAALPPGAGGWQPAGPTWDPQKRVLTVSLPKGMQTVVPLSSYLLPDDLKLMGVWQWLREYIDRITLQIPSACRCWIRQSMSRKSPICSSARVEGGHWMLTPPRLLTLVHAVQQPIGLPEFTALAAQHEPYGTHQ